MLTPDVSIELVDEPDLPKKALHKQIWSPDAETAALWGAVTPCTRIEQDLTQLLISPTFNLRGRPENGWS